MTVSLICVLLLMCLALDNRHFMPLALFSVPAALFQVVNLDLSGHYSYILAAVVDLMVITAISQLQHIDRYALHILMACIASIVLNGVGFLMYWSYMDPWLYDGLFIVLYTVVVFLTIRPIRNGIRERHSLRKPASRLSRDSIFGRTSVSGGPGA